MREKNAHCTGKNNKRKKGGKKLHKYRKNTHSPSYYALTAPQATFFCCVGAGLLSVAPDAAA